MLYRIVAPHFVAGFVAENGIITHAAPILKWGIGRRTGRVCVWAYNKGYDVRRVE